MYEQVEVSEAEYMALAAAVSAAESTQPVDHSFPFHCSFVLAKKPGTFSIHARPCLPSSVANALLPFSIHPDASLPSHSNADPATQGVTGETCFPLSAHDTVYRLISEVAQGALVTGIPCDIRGLVETTVAKNKQRSRTRPLYSQVAKAVGVRLWARLLPFQKTGVMEAIRLGGRLLLADDMGMGKTVTALAIAQYYKNEDSGDSEDEISLSGADSVVCAKRSSPSHFPVLVLCPPTLCQTWTSAIHEWLPEIPRSAVARLGCAKRDIQVLESLSTQVERDPWDNFSKQLEFMVCSFDTIPRLLQAFSSKRAKPPHPRQLARAGLNGDSTGLATTGFDENDGLVPELQVPLVLVDECHSLKNIETRRSKTCLPVILSAKYRILLSGTPVLSRPVELYPQLLAIFGDSRSDRGFLPKSLFIHRYCGGSSLDGRGASNLGELNSLMSLVAIRRMKTDALDVLPPKVRARCTLVLTQESLNRFDSIFGELDRLQKQATGHLASIETSNNERNCLQAIYHAAHAATATAKIPGVLTRLQQLLDVCDGSNRKVLVFGHHLNMLDSVQGLLRRTDIPHIRIDGATNTKVRQSLADKFQLSPSIRVAVLSIHVASAGLTLTAADWVLFAELDWVPSTLIQAEDRAYRLGRQGTLHVEYVIADGTLDDRLWPAVRRKLKIIGEAMDGIEDGAVSLSISRQCAVLETMGVAVQETLVHSKYNCPEGHFFNPDGDWSEVGSPQLEVQWPDVASADTSTEHGTSRNRSPKRGVTVDANQQNKRRKTQD